MMADECPQPDARHLDPDILKALRGMGYLED